MCMCACTRVRVRVCVCAYLTGAKTLEFPKQSKASKSKAGGKGCEGDTHVRGGEGVVHPLSRIVTGLQV